MFKGFSEKTGSFLWELAFNNERPWFLEHKQEFEELVNSPFKALAQETFKLMELKYPGKNMIVRQYISDSYNYNYIIKDFEKRNKKKPYFAFNVTMQNHGGYIAKRDNVNVTVNVNVYR